MTLISNCHMCPLPFVFARQKAPGIKLMALNYGESRRNSPVAKLYFRC